MQLGYHIHKTKQICSEIGSKQVKCYSLVKLVHSHVCVGPKLSNRDGLQNLDTSFAGLWTTTHWRWAKAQILQAAATFAGQAWTVHHATFFTHSLITFVASKQYWCWSYNAKCHWLCLPLQWHWSVVSSIQATKNIKKTARLLPHARSCWADTPRCKHSPRRDQVALKSQGLRSGSSLKWPFKTV